ncbi:alpha-hydroxy-acid oxidizing protein [Maricaulaceae bacterium EIL42A08]|nr:alpha-hydroxy-acid oxidizing protein [Maricaulaceae bacterium EIL42A08]
MGVSNALNINDLRMLAQKRLPRMVFDYIDGGADDEHTLRNNTQRFRDRELLWNVLVNVSEIDLSTRVMGLDLPLPFILAPTAAQRLFHPHLGELATARAANRHGVAYGVSTLATQTLEDIAEAHPGPKIFQLYVWKNRALLEGILERAKAAGYTGLVLTVDLPVMGNRERDPRNGFSVPVQLNTKTIPQALTRPGYLIDLMRGGPAVPANFNTADNKDALDRENGRFDPSISWEYLTWLRDQWDGPLGIKGLSRPDDARRALDAGVDTIWISNHGGRQLDTCPATIDTLGPIADAINGQADIILDGGIRRGTDIIKALALGANAVAVGRAYLYGLAAGGEAGVSRAIEILSAETRRGMELMGRRSLKELSAEDVVG